MWVRPNLSAPKGEGEARHGARLRQLDRDPLQFGRMEPTLLHLLMSVFYVLQKVLRPVIQKPVELVLLRFHESKKGVLRTFAIGAGAIAKLLDEAIKYIS